MIRIVEFSNGKFAVRVGLWPFHSYLDKDGSVYRWRVPSNVRKWCMVNTLEDAHRLMDAFGPHKIVRVIKP